MKTHTRGNIIVENIKIGDIHYEFDYGFCIKSKVITNPVFSNGMWEWKSINEINGNVINYGVAPEHWHYAPKLYDYEAYGGCKFI